MLPYGAKGHTNLLEGYWWVELGGMNDSIGDTENLKQELLEILLGVWDHIKNHGDHDAENIAIDWLQFLPSKRESRRYIGDYILNQNDIESGGMFSDTIAYGGWSMDDHHSSGFYAVNQNAPATIFHQAPSPYGIPYRSLYSKNIDNLFVGGRLCSCTHAALSSTRVIGTCTVMGQAAGTAAALALENDLTPRETGNIKIEELQQELLRQDCFIPGVRLNKTLPDLLTVKTSGKYHESLNDGFVRPESNNQHKWRCSAGDFLKFEFTSPHQVNKITLILDSGLQHYIALVPGNPECRKLPLELIKNFTVKIR